MTILRAVEVKCDICGDSIRLDSPRINDEWQSLSQEGWTRSRGLHFCPKHNAEIAGRDSERSTDSLVAGCTEPDRERCPRLCMEFCNKREEANAEARRESDEASGCKEDSE
jgi:hypothetical protein